jgi:hypothetical protein
MEFANDALDKLANFMVCGSNSLHSQLQVSRNRSADCLAHHLLQTARRGGARCHIRPHPSQIRAYSQLSLAQKVTICILLEPNEAFVDFVRMNPALLDRPNRFAFLKDLVELTGFAG